LSASFGFSASSQKCRFREARKPRIAAAEFYLIQRP
jgi:hypothetical protein